jgi:hypothetical protein
MFNLLNPAKFVRQFTKMKDNGELSFQSRAIARWDNEGGAPKASERQNIPQFEKHRHQEPMSEGEPDTSPMREASPGSKSRELRARDDLYHQSLWKGQN